MTRILQALAQVAEGTSVRDAVASVFVSNSYAFRAARGHRKLSAVAAELGFSKACLGHFEANSLHKVSESRLYAILAKYAAMEAAS